VTSAEVDESPHRAFSAAARDAVRQWRFEPGTVDGRPAATELTITINFRTD
jgi:TonB family protein